VHLQSFTFFEVGLASPLIIPIYTILFSVRRDWAIVPTATTKGTLGCDKFSLAKSSETKEIGMCDYGKQLFKELLFVLYLQKKIMSKKLV
jgi:hypothetical protein